MKNQLFILICLCLLTNYLSGQPDMQWLMWNNLGKDGILRDGISNDYQNSIGTEFTLKNVRHASYTVTRPARTDLFVIYGDGAHYNSRYLDDPGFFHPDETSLPEYVNHNFETNYTRAAIANGYLTRTYEGDDPPDSVQVISGLSGQNSTPFTFDVTIYTATAKYPNDTIRANHDVVKGKDITIIVDQFKLEQYAKQKQLDYDFYLVFDEIQPARTDLANVGTNKYFDLEPIFYRSSHHPDEPCFPMNTYSYSSSEPQKIKLIYDTNKQYTYVNLRPTDEIAPYGPDEDGLRYNAIFKIVNGSDVTITQMAEPILSSHDPNFIRVDSIVCGDDYQEVYYHLQFQNTSPLSAANHVSAGISFPSHFDISSFTPIEYVMRGSRVNGSITDQRDVYTFHFGTNSSLDVCASLYDITDCTGYVKFKINVPARTNLRNTINSLALRNPHTIFDGQTYPIGIFEDWVIRDPNHQRRWIRPINCGGTTIGGLCWWHYLLGLLVILLVIGIILWSRRDPVTS